jgi:hypothetical protein
VIELRDDTRLAIEATAARFRHRPLGPHDLQGDRSIQSRVTRAIHLAHAARADQGDDLEHTEAIAGREAHGLAHYSDSYLAATLSPLAIEPDTHSHQRS